MSNINNKNLSLNYKMLVISPHLPPPLHAYKPISLVTKHYYSYTPS